jgi:hypothetical protein
MKPALVGKFAFASALVWSASCPANADSPGAASAHFAVVHHENAAGGGRSASALFEVVSSVNSIGAGLVGTSTSFSDRRGFVGQLNESPVSSPVSFTSQPGRPVKFLLSALLTHTFDADDDASLSFIDLPESSLNGVSMSVLDDWLIYNIDAQSTSADSFTYTVSDGIDQSVGVVTLSVNGLSGITLNIQITPKAGENLLRVFGIPGRNYQIQTTGDLALPIVWTNLGSPKLAPANGLMQVTDSAPPTTRFYRAIQP